MRACIMTVGIQTAVFWLHRHSIKHWHGVL